jgi:hypothetical protein
MRYILLFLALTSTLFLFSFAMKGDIQSWEIDDFISSDAIGDKLEKYGDISSLFARVEGDRLFVRITFDDMLTRKKNKLIADHFKNEDISVRIFIEHKENKTVLLNQQISVSETVKKKIQILN